MKDSIAHRRLSYSEKGKDVRADLTIYIGTPKGAIPESGV